MPDVLGSELRLRETQPVRSSRRAIARRKLMPQVSLLGSNDSVLNGIAISVIQPRSSTVEAVYQMPSQFHCSSLMFWNSPSWRRPFGFVMKR